MQTNTQGIRMQTRHCLYAYIVRLLYYESISDLHTLKTHQTVLDLHVSLPK